MLVVLRAPSMSGLPFYIAEDRGFFEKEGVKVRCLHSHDAKRRVVQLLVEGEIAFYTSISAIVEAVTQGAKVKALCATSSSRYPCAARENIRSFADLKNKKVIVLANLEPRKLKGIDSQGMILAVGNKEAKTCVLITPEKDMPPGTRIS